MARALDPAVLPERPREPLLQTSGLTMILQALDPGPGKVVTHAGEDYKFGMCRSRSKFGPAHVGFGSSPLRVDKTSDGVLGAG